MDDLRRKYLGAMGIDVWVRRGAAPAKASAPPPDAPAAAIVSEPATSDVASMDWEALQATVAQCNRCAELIANRRQTVFGVGDRGADWLVIGEAPGADEDRQGEPFVGRAGKLLNNMLWAIGLAREQVYIANILKCRPPKNRDPKPQEAAACEGYLRRQIALIRPKIILVVGRVAAQHLLGTDRPIGRLRGEVRRYDDLPMVVTYHPAYLLRSPLEKRKVWDDLRLAQTTYRAAVAALNASAPERE